ncbi:hypothetical protein CRYUN_Cryun34aG0014300 [Craigia yunnanensis]
MLSLVHHPNLLNLIGYRADGDKRILVYEYMPNGSLENHLLDLLPGQEPLDWNTRLKIAEGAAKGLEYPHNFADSPIIYRDFKASNILLDANVNPKLSDLDLQRQLTTKSYVHSFGVVFLELISGRRAIDIERPQKNRPLLLGFLSFELSLLYTLVHILQEEPLFKDRQKFTLMVDPLLEEKFPVKCLYKALAVAAMCLQEEADTRPLIDDVVTALEFLARPKDSDKIAAELQRNTIVALHAYEILLMSTWHHYVLNLLSLKQIEPNLEIYNATIRALCESRSLSSVYSILVDKESKGVKSTAMTFGTLLSGFYKEKYEDVGKVFNFMKEHEIPVGVSTYNIWIQSLCMLKKSNEAKALLHGMLSKGIKPNSVTYNHLIHGFCKVSICTESMEKKWIAKFSTMKSLVNGLASISKVEEANKLTQNVKEFSKYADMWDEIQKGFTQQRSWSTDIILIPRATARMPPVDVPHIRSNSSCILFPVPFSISLRISTVARPFMPPPSNESIRRPCFVSDAKANVTTTCSTETSSSGAGDFKAVSMGCMMPHFINRMATETSAARVDKAEQACSTLHKSELLDSAQ